MYSEIEHINSVLTECRLSADDHLKVSIDRALKDLNSLSELIFDMSNKLSSLGE